MLTVTSQPIYIKDRPCRAAAHKRACVVRASISAAAIIRQAFVNVWKTIIIIGMETYICIYTHTNTHMPTLIRESP